MAQNESSESLEGVAEALRREAEIEADPSAAITLEELKAGISTWHQEELKRLEEADKNGESKFIPWEEEKKQIRREVRED